MKRIENYRQYIAGTLAFICMASLGLYAATTTITTTTISSASTPPKVISRPLFYPNPFRLSDGSHLGYELSQDTEITLKIFDIFGNEHLHKVYPEGAKGGIIGYNKVPIDDRFFTTPLSSGVYYFLLINNGHVLQKGKFIIKP